MDEIGNLLTTQGNQVTTKQSGKVVGGKNG